MIRVALFRDHYLDAHEDYCWHDEEWVRAYHNWHEWIDNGSLVQGVLWFSGDPDDASDDVILERYP